MGLCVQIPLKRPQWGNNTQSSNTICRRRLRGWIEGVNLQQGVHGGGGIEHIVHVMLFPAK